MNPIVFAMRRPVTTMLVVGVVISGGVLASNTMRSDIVRTVSTPDKMNGYLDYIGSCAKQAKEFIVGQYESFFHKHEDEHKEEPRKVVVTSPTAMDVTITQPYVCQIHSQRHIEVQALDSGYLEAIAVREGQAVKKGDLMFKIQPVLYTTRRDAELAEARLAELEYLNTKSLFDSNKVVSANEVKLFEAKKDRAKARADQAQAELDFTEIRARFDGIVDRQRQQLGSFIKEGEVLTTLSDNSVMWVYFNVPEKQYLEYKAAQKQHEAEDRIELMLANHDKFPEKCARLTIEAQFNNETGNIPFRADFPNPPLVAGDERTRLLRHGQTGTILVNRTLKNAVVIPQRATFELLDKRYVWVVGEDEVAHQRLITIEHELEDIFVINSGLKVSDKIVLEGVRQVEEGAKVEYDFRKPEEAVKNQKFHAE